MKSLVRAIAVSGGNGLTYSVKGLDRVFQPTRETVHDYLWIVLYAAHTYRSSPVNLVSL